MENASKALIIAGSILLAIAIIGIGMYIYQNAAGAMEGTDLTAEQVDTYNQTFTNYSGVQRGSNVKTMLDRIATHNRTAIDVSEKVQILYGTPTADVEASAVNEDNTKTEHINDIKSKNIKSGVSYDITFGYDSTSGKITTVYINQK